MRTLHNIFNRRREIERIEALSEIFRYSRSEDMAKAFELGRIEALSKLRKELYAVIISLITIAAAIIGFSTVYVINDYMTLKLNNAIYTKVNEEIEKRIDAFRNFFSESKEVIPFSVLVIRASNDNRIAFYDLLAVSENTAHSYHQFADEVILNITANILPSLMFHLDNPQNSETTINKLEHIDLNDAYRKTPRIYRVSFLMGIWRNKNISKREKLDFAATVIRDDDSLKAVEAAREILDEEAKIGADVRDIAKYIEWWKQNRERY